MKKIFIYACLCFLIFPASAHAQLIGRVCEGIIPCSFEQFKTGETYWYNRADINHDGIIDAQEQALTWQNYASDLLPACKGIQNVKPLKLTHLPTDEQMHKDFGMIDTNHDGVIDLQEDMNATAEINQSCRLFMNPQVQKLQQMLQQYQQGKTGTTA